MKILTTDVYVNAQGFCEYAKTLEMAENATKQGFSLVKVGDELFNSKLGKVVTVLQIKNGYINNHLASCFYFSKIAKNDSIAGILSALWGGKKWNGKIYKDTIYIDGDPVKLSIETMDILKERKTPEELGAEKISEKQDLSAKYGVKDSDFCTVTTWFLQGKEFITVAHNF